LQHKETHVEHSKIRRAVSGGVLLVAGLVMLFFAWGYLGVPDAEDDPLVALVRMIGARGPWRAGGLDDLRVWSPSHWR
jgi:hypothetical protein